jgi:DcuC family C4-dicarboxylate transporter
MLLIAGVLIVLATIYLLIRQYENRMVLFCAAVAMFLLAGNPMGVFKSFTDAIRENTQIIEPIIAVMGFSWVMKITECDKHLILLLAKSLRRPGPFLIPGATLVTLAVNTSITSAAGCSAAVGAILIPLLMAKGVHPAMAGAAVFAGTFSAMLNPGFAQVVVIADVAKTTPIAVIRNHTAVVIICGVIGALVLGGLAFCWKEYKGYTSKGAITDDVETFHVNLVKAAVPVLPLALLLLGNTGVVPAFKQLGISHAMIIGVFVAFLVTWKNPGALCKAFWDGAGYAFSASIGIIICALCFVGGMNAIGLIKTMMDAMISNPQVAKFSSAFGPFFIAVVSGSGETAGITFNRAVTAHAAQFGLLPMSMGSVASISGGLGRAMSPVAAGTIICAAYDGVNPMEIAKRNAPGMIVAVIVLMIYMFYL